jgi:LPXTG-motif cell wall-anchored protein
MPRRLFGVATCAAVLLALAAGTASAQLAPIDKRTYFTFSGPVSIPGATLPAGKYLFRLADSANRDVVQVLSSDGLTPYAMFFAMRVQRTEAAAEPEIRFMETAANMPVAVDTWWYPNERGGYAFVYPKEQLRRLLVGTRPNILTQEEYDPESRYGRLYAEEGAAVTAPYQEEPWYDTEGQYARLYPEEPSGAFLIGEVAPQSVPVAEPAVELPTTASPLPLVTLAGIVLLGSGALVAGMRRRRT